MKGRIVIVAGVVSILVMSIFVVSAVAKEVSTQMNKMSCPMPAMRYNPQEMMQRCRVMMGARVFVDSPGAIYGQSEVLKLSAKQKQQLIAIENEARRKALAVLTDSQKKQIGKISVKPMVMSRMCQQMCPRMRSMMMGKKMMGSQKGQGQGCPMMRCPMMGGKGMQK